MTGGILNGALYLRLGLRRVLSSPSFAVTAVVTLGLAVGALTATFAVADAMLLRPLPYHEGARLVDVGYAVPGYGFDELPFSVGTFVHTRQEQRSFSDFAIYYDADRYNVGLVDPERVPVARVTPGFFGVFQAPPSRGRPFNDSDAAVGANPVVIVSHDLWNRRWGGDTTLVGRTIYVEGVDRQVVAIAPKGFRFPDRRTGLWIPFTIDPADLVPMGFGYPGVGRLAPGVSLDAARDDLQRITSQLSDVFPDNLTPQWAERGRFTSKIRPLSEKMVGSLAEEVWLVFATATLLLLLTVANLTNLFLVREEARTKELSIRRALGSGLSDLLALPLSEGLVVGVLSGGGGLALAGILVGLATRVAPPDLPRVDEIGLGPGVIALGFAVAVGAAVLFALVPLLATGARGVGKGLADRSATQSRGTRRMQNVLVALQAAVAVALLIGAGLLLRSARNLSTLDPGFRAEDALVFEIGLPAQEYDAPQRARTWQLLVDQIQAIDAVEAVGAGEFPPLLEDFRKGPLQYEGEDLPDGESGPMVDLDRTTPGFLAALGVPVVEGRPLTVDDGPGGYPGVLVNQTLARLHLPAGSPLGRRIRITRRGEYYEIVGVVGDMRTVSFRDEPIPFVYLPPGATTPSSTEVPTAMTFTVRTAQPLDRVLPALTDAVAAVDPKLPLGSPRALTDVVSDHLARARFITWVLLAMAFTGLVLGTVGVYGVVSYVGVRRRKEVGVCIALGARTNHVVRSIVGSPLAAVLVGAVVGMGVAALAGRLAASVLFGVTSTDPLTYVLAVALVAVSAVVASLSPAWRASRVDPSGILREE